MSLKEVTEEKVYNDVLDTIAKSITEYDFSDVPVDNTSEACYNLARDLYHVSDEEADKIVDIIMDKYVSNIK